MTRPVAVVGFAQATFTAGSDDRGIVEMLNPVVRAALADAGLRREQIGFTCSGSCDYLAGAPFSFVEALDAVGAWPPIQESHVEQDGAWALYEAWVRLQHGDVETALVYAFGKSSTGDLAEILTLQLDPYYLAPLWPDPTSLAALQARAFHDARGDQPGPIDAPPVTDGAAAVVLAAGDTARALAQRPAWITGIDHRIEPHGLGVRDLTRSVSTERAGQVAGVAAAPVDVAELHACHRHEELILRAALGLSGDVPVNPSGGPRAANPVMATGLIRIGEAANRIRAGEADRALAHATSGPCLQQNLICLLEGRRDG